MIVAKIGQMDARDGCTIGLAQTPVRAAPQCPAG